MPSLHTLVASLPRVLAVAAFTLGLAAPAVAQEADLPGRVGRLADLAGDVYVSTEEGSQDWIEALRNYTVTAGDNLWVAAEGRAEIDYGGGQFRLDGDTNVHVARLDDRILALFVAQGRVIIRVRVLDPGEVARIDTPNTQLTLTRPGLYRVEVSQDREHTDLVVREGEALVALTRGEQQVLPGQTASVAGSDPDYADVRSGFTSAGFDSWSASRDRSYERSRATSYVSRQMVGYADLDDNGEWTTYPEYGAVWFPTRVQEDWAPYRYGRWTWVGAYGWTWVDDAPWGYAPFHYGRWAHVGSRWGWIPGGYVARPVWAPALVGWYGGSGWSASISLGAPVYGWVALGWGEAYRPSWRCSRNCWTRHNRPYAVNLAERSSAPPTRYTNWSAPGGVTAVAGAAFTGRRPVQSNLVQLQRNNLAGAPVLAQAPVLDKPTAATIPGARPRGSAPPPAERFFRNTPLQVAPAIITAPDRSRPAQSWGNSGLPASGPISAPPGRVARPVAPAPSANAPGQPRGTAPGAAPGAPGAIARPPQSSPQGTWGAPSAVQPAQRLTPQAPQHAARPQDIRPPRNVNAPAVNPSAGIPIPRSAPPSRPASAAPAQPAGPAPVVRSAPPASPTGAPPQGVRSAPRPNPSAAAPAQQAVRPQASPAHTGKPPGGKGPYVPD